MRVGISLIRFRALSAVSLSLLVVCLHSSCADTKTPTSTQPKTLSTPAASPSPPVPLKGNSSTEPETTYDGFTLDEWKVRLKNLGPGLPGAKAAVPGLLEIATDTNVPATLRRQATLMLGRLGKASLSALPDVTQMLQVPADKTARPATWAAKAIALWGPLAKDATPQVVTTLVQKETPLETRLACLEALAQIGANHVEVIPTLTQHLTSPPTDLPRSEQLELQMAATDALALIGPNANIAVPDLMTFASHRSDLFRHKVVLALGAIGPAAGPAATTLAELLVFDEAEEVRRQAALSLSRLGPNGEELLVNLASDEERIVREFSITALGTSQPRTAIVKQVLLDALDDEADPVRLEALKSLIQNPGEDRDRLLRTVEDLLLTADRRTRREVADLISQLKLTPEEWEQLAMQVETSNDAYTQRLWESLRKE